MNRPRELTVAQLIERLEALPGHYFVSPLVDGTLGAGLDVWVTEHRDNAEHIVVFGEREAPTPAIVDPAWVTA